MNTNTKNSKAGAVKSGKDYYDWLAKEIKIDGIISIERDHAFDDAEGRSGGIRLHYKSYTPSVGGLKDGILLEAGFDTVTPNNSLTISSWAYDRAADNPDISIVDNRALEIACYHPGYTLLKSCRQLQLNSGRSKKTTKPIRT